MADCVRTCSLNSRIGLCRPQHDTAGRCITGKRRSKRGRLWVQSHMGVFAELRCRAEQLVGQLSCSLAKAAVSTSQVI
eukprot:353445-Chlamydomonas_euryale.AAC.5